MSARFLEVGYSTVQEGELVAPRPGQRVGALWFGYRTTTDHSSNWRISGTPAACAETTRAARSHRFGRRAPSTVATTMWDDLPGEVGRWLV